MLRTLRRLARETKHSDAQLDRGVHYVAFYSDRMPTLHRVVFNLGAFTIPQMPRIPTVDDPRWTGDFRDDTDQMLLARAIYGEARGQNDAAKTGVAWSIRNRVEDTRPDWGNTYYDVITQHEQYSAFNLSDRNRKHVEDPFFSDRQADRIAWTRSYAIAGQVLAGTVDDPAHRANHYYDDSRSRPPSWATKQSFVIKIDRIIFHRR